MAEVERLFAQYKEAHQAGEGDPRPFIAQVSGLDREQLAALIDAYLEHAPRRELDRAGFRESPAAAVAEGVQRSLAGSSGMWPALLPRLRAQARLRRADLVAELAARLGAQSQQQKVAAYYHEMEQGLLPSSGVSDSVLDALGKIVGWSRDALRRAGEMPAPGGAPSEPAPGAVFARTSRRDQAEDGEDTVGPPPPAEWDEVDRLFRGGA
jgi:hypothetical protein